MQKSKCRRSGGGSVRKRSRRGAVLVLFVVLLTVIVGLLGLVIDTGRMMASHREAQNAADAAALAGAYDLMRGKTAGQAETSAVAFVQTYNGMSTAAGPFLHIPPTTGTYAGSANAVEAIVNYPMNTLFVHVLGGSQSQMIQARAVARFENVAAGEGAIVLDPSAIPGIAVGGNGTLKVIGDVIVNSAGGGVDENNVPVNNGNNGVAADGGTSSNSTNGIYATNIMVVGGVNNPALFKNIDPANPASPLHAKELPGPDPLAFLTTPTVGNGVINTTYGKVSVGNNNNVTLNPGIYQQLKITGGTAVLKPGIYVISASNTNGLQITGGNVTAKGIMFYNTGSNYDPNSGAPDNTDSPDPLNLTPPPSASQQSGVQYGDVTINAGMQFTPINTADMTLNYTAAQRAALKPFDGMLFYQRRKNPVGASIEGNSSTGKLTGTIYAKWAKFKITGSGNYDAQYVVGSIALTGGGIVTLNYNGTNVAKAPQVFLVY